ncbi:general stress protein [Peribacillus sp. NJ4]|uniref:general stress protein n=1 Tax=Peribacillus TaxID=2675229 RepID=UPI0025A06422|nr:MULTISPECIES: general stress protein [unclassified Peribacillus]MDM5211395.1 general stress protein [Peribacillus sp. NJ4]MDM5221710.1 general stress protein [Peribacillus sp. NJ11]
MEKNIYGVFDSNPELLAAIQDLQAKGVTGSQMTVAADIKNDVQLGNEHTDILIIANQDKEDTLFLKIFHYFTDEGSGDLRSFFTKYGYSFAETKAMLKEVGAKKFILLIDEEVSIEELKAGAGKVVPMKK